MIGKHDPVALGFSVHTGWAAMTTVSGTATSPVVLDRCRLEMMRGSDPEWPRFVYHAARELRLEDAERFVARLAELSRTIAKAALEAAVEPLRENGYEVVASSIITSDRPLTASLEGILKSHSLVHSAEGALFRGAIRSASGAIGIAAIDVRSGDLNARAAHALGIGTGRLEDHLTGIGRAAGRPWGKDQRQSYLAAVVALLAHRPGSGMPG